MNEIMRSSFFMNIYNVKPLALYLVIYFKKNQLFRLANKTFARKAFYALKKRGINTFLMLFYTFNVFLRAMTLW